MASVITVGAIDDDRMLLDGLSAWLRGLDDLRLVHVATTVGGFLAAGAAADVVLLDLNLRDHSVPVDNVVTLRAAGLAVLMVSAIPDAEQVLATIEAGAAGYISKDHDLAELATAVREVAGGGSAFTPELAFILSRDSRPVRPRLSPQEQAILTAYASGSTLQAAARRAGVAYGTARSYLERIKHKYSEAGWPTRTKLDLAERLREHRLELGDLPDRSVSRGSVGRYTPLPQNTSGSAGHSTNDRSAQVGHSAGSEVTDDLTADW